MLPLALAGANIASGEEVAIKLECVKTKHPQLHIESKFYKMMQGGGGYRGAPGWGAGGLWSSLRACIRAGQGWAWGWSGVSRDCP